MPKVKPENTPRRRAFLGHLVVSAGVVSAVISSADSAAALPENPDAELIAACRKFDSLEHEFIAMTNKSKDVVKDDECDTITDRIEMAQHPILENMKSLNATTMAGIIARVRTLMLYDGTVNPDRLNASEYWNERLLGMLLRDLVAFADRSAALGSA